ncbi:predicted protein [Postia placenta Mad-698-R]|nr:predicted protein [Postia placenta Mad-698-R]
MRSQILETKDYNVEGSLRDLSTSLPRTCAALTHVPSEPQHFKMGQYWMLANLDKRETFGMWGKLGEFFYSDFTKLVEFILTPYPHPSPDSVLAKHKPYVRTMETGKALGRLDLPGEILYFIFDNITSFQDALFLTLANPLLEPFGHRRMYELICLCQQRWKGDRIICLGDYARDDDLPKGLLSETELQELQDKLEELQDRQLEELQDKQLNLYDHMSEDWPEIKRDGGSLAIDTRWTVHTRVHRPRERSAILDMLVV